MPRARRSIESIERLAHHLVGATNGRFIGLRHAYGEFATRCEQPVTVNVWSRSTESVKLMAEGKTKPGMQATYTVDCRKCPTCLKRRAWQWTQRALAEYDQHNRTWFLTLTARPDEHVRLEIAARGRSSPNFDYQTDVEKFPALSKEFGHEVTKYLKRLRETYGRFRYLAVCEIHASERTSPEMRNKPHYHLLIHEPLGQTLLKRNLQDAWKLGFTSVSLARSRGVCMYIAKYISKATDVRIRASQNYGNMPHLPDDACFQRTLAELRASKSHNNGTKDARVVTDPPPALKQPRGVDPPAGCPRRFAGLPTPVEVFPMKEDKDG